MYRSISSVFRRNAVFRRPSTSRTPSCGSSSRPPAKSGAEQFHQSGTEGGEGGLVLSCLPGEFGPADSKPIAQPGQYAPRLRLGDQPSQIGGSARDVRVRAVERSDDQPRVAPAVEYI